MTKIRRSYSISKIYHIILKGIDSQDIFYDDHDRNFFLNALSKSKTEFDLKIFAFCLMDNHVHMVIKSEKEFLSKSIQSLTIRYVQHFNKKYKRTGTLVQSRFRSRNIESLRYFLEVCKYVHQNPENAGFSKTENYKWSSYQEYIGKAKIIDKSTLLYYFDNDIDSFIKYTTKNTSYEYLENLSEYELTGRLTDVQVSDIIMKIFHLNDISNIPYFFKTLDKDTLKESIIKMKKIKGTNITQLSRIIRVNRKLIEKTCE